MAVKGALLRSQYEREREKNLLENQLMLAQLFGTTTPVAPARRIINKLLTSKEVDALEQLYESKNRDQKRKRPVEVLSKEVRERQAKLLEAGRVNHCHLCANYMKSGWIPCSRCEQRFHYLCLKRRLKINANKFAENWLCPICLEVCNCDDCWDSEWKHSNRPVRRLQSSGYDWRRGSEDAPREDMDTDQGGQKNGRRRSQRKQLRSIVGEKQDGWEDMGSRLSYREQPRRAAAQATRGRFREVESLSEDEDDWIRPSTRGPKHERESERRKGNYVDDVESGEDRDEVEDEGDVDKSGEDADSDGDEDEYVNRMERGLVGHYFTSEGPLGRECEPQP